MVRFRISLGERAFRVLNYLFLFGLALITLYPFWYILQASFSHPVYPIRLFWPQGFYYVNYWTVFSRNGIGQAYLITVLRVLVAVPLMLTVTGSTAFALTRRELKGRSIIIFYYFITMFVSGGLIPFYMLLKTVGLLDTFWVLVLPVMFSVWSMIVMKTSFQGLPEGLVEAGLIDGASYGRIFFRIILPLSMPMLATLGLFQAVWHWNDWFMGAFYTSNPKLRPLQTFVRHVLYHFYGYRRPIDPLQKTDVDPRLVLDLLQLTPESMRKASIVTATLPMLIVYPFIQRYFIKGVLIGSIKE